MYFKKLELIGFKSFADKTVIQFEPGVTAIVGPNGCGKSNIADAIRWVLGEQSAKSLRGSSMEDVIFNGSSIKEPLNLAEVSLTLSNESRILPIDYQEVIITRRLYRSGESEYLLNGNVVRLKDINELLMGSGIGNDSYSIIEQGKMDGVLNAKPEDRRVIFEEAAGITKFKSKKKEALRKLEQTDANLLRINDIIQEVKRQIGSTERQAKKAEIYRAEFEKLKTLELQVAVREFLTYEDDRRVKEEDLAKLRSEEALCHEIVFKADAQYQQKRAGLDDLDHRVNDTGTKEVLAQGEVRRLQDRLGLNRERIGELAERKGNIAREIEQIEGRVTGLRSQLQGLESQAAGAVDEETRGRALLDAAQNDGQAVENACAEGASRYQTIERQLQELRGRISGAGAEIAKVRAEINAAGLRLRRARHDEQNLLNQIRETDERLLMPLFEGQSLSQIESKVREWKDRLLSIVRGWLGRPEREITSDDEQSWEREVRRFADEVGRLQGTVDHQEIELRHQREHRGGLEERLGRLAAEIREFETEENSLRQKERALETTAATASEEEQSLLKSLSEAQEILQQKRGDRETLLVGLAQTRSKQEMLAERRAQAEKDRNWILETERGQIALAESLKSEAEESTARRAALEAEIVTLGQDIEHHSSEREGHLRALEGLRHQRDDVMQGLLAVEQERQEKQQFLDQAREKVHGFEMRSTEIRFEMDRLKDRIFNAYQADLTLEAERKRTELEAGQALFDEQIQDVETAKAQVQALKDKLAKMGPVNLVAIEEYDEMRQRFDFLTQQQQDLVQAKDDLHKAIIKINRTTRELFAETFAKIQKHFTEYYKLLFGGGSAELILLDESDVLESGIEIVARPPGKKLQNISLLSGGEKALTAIALLFSIFKVKPSPFCILDEIDAPLDEPNIDRFCAVLKEFITQSQFILVTHNKRTMNLADAMYGITMAETGVSRIVSVRFSEKAALSAQGGSASGGNGNGHADRDKTEVLV